jgi:hypothetical protein
LKAGPKLFVIRNGLLLALAFAAGYIDALGYLGLNRVFTANMTGNTVLLSSHSHSSMSMPRGTVRLRVGRIPGGRGGGCADC